MGACKSKDQLAFSPADGVGPSSQGRIRQGQSSQNSNTPKQRISKQNSRDISGSIPEETLDGNGSDHKQNAARNNTKNQGNPPRKKRTSWSTGPSPGLNRPRNGSSNQANYISNTRLQPDVQFSEFKDREKSVIETILECDRHLRMAALNFQDLKLQKIIGVGAFGEVIKGTYCGTPVVVKRMLRTKIDEGNIKVFSEEIQLMMNLRHPNIVQFIGASWNSYSNVCLVTEFLERGDLFSVLRNPKYQLSWADPILRMTIDTSRGMAYLHSMKPPLIHRDLKSMNILVSSTFGCKISDFGLSREKSIDETMSITGTPLWLPPEMIRGERYTEKADVFSFGIVLSEFDTRKIPYHDIKAKGAKQKKVSGSTLMHMVAYENLRPSLSPNCMKSLRSLFERCTADNEAMRPSFEQIVAELDGPIREETMAQQISGENATAPFPDSLSPEDLGVKVATKYNEDIPKERMGQSQ